MRKTKVLLISLMVFALMISGTAAFAEEGVAESNNVITVNGQGLVKIAPNVAEISFAVLSEAPEAGAAMTKNAQAANKVIGALKGSGIAASDIATTGYSLHPKYVYEENRAPRLTGYEVRNEVQVTVRSISNVGKVIDLAVKNGINEVRNISYTSEGNLEQKKQALLQAVQDARVKADVIAGALGKKIVGVKSSGGDWQDTSPPQVYYERKALDSAVGYGSSVPINPGLVEIRASAQVVYIIE